MALPEEFGNYTNYDERLLELNSRIIGWYLEALKIDNDLTGIFNAAQRNLEPAALEVLRKIAQDPEHVVEIIEGVPLDMVLVAFEGAMNDLDVVQQFADNEMDDPDAMNSGQDVAGQLKDLAALHDTGALSDEEFSAAKQRVLGEV